MTSGGNNTPHASKHATEHVSRAKDAAIVDESQKAPNWLANLPRIIAVGLIVLFIFVWFRGCSSERRAEAQAKDFRERVKTQERLRQAAAQAPPPVVLGSAEFPSSGEGFATKSEGIKCWLDPMRSSTRPSVPAEYVFADRPSFRYTDRADRSINNSNFKKWRKMPAGNYIVYPRDEGDDLYFRWKVD